jgi:hypothetical protein
VNEPTGYHHPRQPLEWVQSPDVAAHEAAGQQMNNDSRYLAKIYEISALFVEGSGHVLLGQRLA